MTWVNMGVAAPILSEPLYRDLGIDRGRDLDMRLGPIGLQVEGKVVIDGAGRIGNEDLFGLLFAPRRVEAVLPAGVLRHFDIAIDGSAGTLTLAAPASLRPKGNAIPIRPHAGSGIVLVDAVFGGERVTLALDPGAPATWVRARTAATWLARHPEWRRGTGAFGRANLAMTELDLEKSGTRLGVPDVQIGTLRFDRVAAFAPAPLGGAAAEMLVGDLFWDRWQAGIGEPADGWIGLDLIGRGRLTISHASRRAVFERVPPDPKVRSHAAPLTLARRGSGYEVTGIAIVAVSDPVSEPRPGDQLVAVDGRDISGWPPDAVLDALSGRIGERRVLEILRNGTPLRVEVPVESLS